jgi:heme-degrading monooxygenase HmoA
MKSGLLSIAYIWPEAGKDEETLRVLLELYSLLSRKGYSRDRLYRDAKSDRLVNLRYWESEEARQQAQEDPDVHRLWQRLAGLCRVDGVLERLEEIPDTWSAVTRQG